MYRYFRQIFSTAKLENKLIIDFWVNSNNFSICAPRKKSSRKGENDHKVSTAYFICRHVAEKSCEISHSVDVLSITPRAAFQSLWDENMLPKRNPLRWIESFIATGLLCCLILFYIFELSFSIYMANLPPKISLMKS